MSFKYGSGYDPRIIDGVKALTVQSFAELNSKTGTQYEASFYDPTLAASGSADIILIVGTTHVIFKDIRLQFDSDLISSQFFQGPSYTGGTTLPSYNLHFGLPGTDELSVLQGATVTDPGTAISSKEYSIGTQGQGNRTVSAVARGLGVERVLHPGTTYLFRFTNEDTVNATRASGQATWYEGPLSVDV